MKTAEAERRTTSQNSKLWPMLHDVASQVKWPVNGYEGLLAPEDWKDIFTSSMKKNQRVAQGIEGGWVLLGERTHKYTKAELGDLLEYIYAFGADKGVVWSEESKP